MHFSFLELLSSVIYLTAVINPISKVLFLVTHDPNISIPRLRAITLKTNIFSLIFLFLMAGFGGFIFTYVFKIHPDTIRVAGGVVLFLIGLQMFLQTHTPSQTEHHKVDADMAIVPLGMPLTVGAGTIVVVNTMAGVSGALITYPSIFLALLVNALVMMLSRPIGRFLFKYDLVNPLYRLTGLLLIALATEMILSGLTGWYVLTQSQAIALHPISQVDSVLR